MAMAEVFDRLADNANISPSKQFKLQYNGQEYRRLDALLQALVDSGHQVDVEINHRIANFAALHAQTPDGKLLDVPAPLMVRTGVKDADGTEAVVPAVHSELLIHVRPGPGTTGPAVNADVKWYQGVSSTGFFACDIHATPEWAGKKTADRFTGADALHSIKLAGMLSDVINASAEAQHLKAAGYGVTGVCNDSVAIIQHALTGRATGYPLLMRDESLKGEIDHRLSDRDRRDDPDYQLLATTIAAVPSDVTANPTLRERALASIPWSDGAEPFTSTVDAKRILAS